jgi:SAM-dependent methyltransferase
MQAREGLAQLGLDACQHPPARVTRLERLCGEAAVVVQVLTEAQRRKWDTSDDAMFYAEPRFVQHLDGAFRQRLTQLYRERIPAGAVVLDLMGSWVSHLPDDVTYASVIGHGLNARELNANPRLQRRWVQNLNTDQRLPLEDASVDATLIVAGWQYLQYPEAIAAELLRITRPGGQLIVAFSNRMFFTKAPQIWADGSDRDHLSYVAEVLSAQGWPVPSLISEPTRAEGLAGLIGAKGDPFFAVIATRPL